MDLYYSTILIHRLILSNDCFNILCIIYPKYSNGRIMSHSLIYYLNDVYALGSYCYFIYHWRLEISIIFSLQTFMIISNVLFFEYNINRRQLTNLNYVLVQGSFFLMIKVITFLTLIIIWVSHVKCILMKWVQYNINSSFLSYADVFMNTDQILAF